MHLLLILCLFGLLFLPSHIQAQPKKKGGKAKECVFLLHGLGRSKTSMKNMEKFFISKGYDVYNLGYASRKYDIETIVEKTVKNEVLSRKNDYEKIHFVTHSMAGIVMRQFFSSYELENVGRTVMLAPPNQGSVLAEKLAKNTLVRKVMGPAFLELGIDENKSKPKQLGEYKSELGIITGDVSLNPLYSKMIPGKDDGKVSIEEAKLDGMEDFLVMSRSHTFIMKRKDVMNQALFFIQHGKFQEN